jgi:RES domain-containing protein
LRVFRICRRAFARSPLDGRGGLAVGGRWHGPPRLVVYASQSLSLASLEVLVHADFDLVPKDLVALELDVPASVKVATLSATVLPRTWRHHPAPASLQRLGNAWLDRASSCVLRIPSAVIPSESNFLLNPKHSDIQKLRVVRRTNFRFDPRLVPADLSTNPKHLRGYGK